VVSGPSATRQASPPGADQVGEALVRRVVTVLAMLVGGLCFLFSVGNVYQLAVELELWVWIRPLVAPAVDLSLVALVVGIRFLARRGVTGRELRRPRVFTLAVGLAAWALNTAGAVAERDWGKVAFDSLAPELLIGWEEVLPWFLRQFQAVTHPAIPSTGPARLRRRGPGGNDGEALATATATAARPRQQATAPAVPAGVPPAASRNGAHPAGAGIPTRSASAGAAGIAGIGRPASATTPAGSGSGERDADAAMRAWWAAQRAAGRTPSGAELELDRVCGRDPRNGAGRKARARYLREEAAGRFHVPQPVPAPEPGAAVPVPVPDHAADPAGAGPVPARAAGSLEGGDR
jgi:hypothetical protein